MELHHIRDDYRKQSLSQKACHADPFAQFKQWLTEAMNAKLPEPTAMSLATVDEMGKPNCRVVLLKEVNKQGFVFFTNYLSRKGRALTQHPYAALTFFWPELERQVRIEGRVEKLAETESDLYFSSRPYTSRIGAWASEQSAPLANKQALLAKAAMISLKYPINVPRPEHWGGYVVVPHLMEFWQGRPSRLHDRIQYEWKDNEWQKVRLSP